MIDLAVEELEYPDLWPTKGFSPEDLLWLKVRGPGAELTRWGKKEVAALLGRTNFRYDPIRTDVGTEAKIKPQMSAIEAMDSVIDGAPDSPEQKAELKRLYRELMS